VVPDEAYAGREWDGKEVGESAEGFRNDGAAIVTFRISDRRLADPRVLSLRELLKAMKP
jgi:hypothetical protein